MAEQIKTRLKNSEGCKSVHHDFGVRDSKGREIGAHVMTGVHEFVAVEPGEPCYSYPTLPAGRYFFFYPAATRNGECYGASQSTRYFDSESARTAAIEKYLAGARKRSAKVAA